MRNIKFSSGSREPRQGELNYELKRIIVKHCSTKSLKDTVKGVQLAVSRLANKFGIGEFNVDFHRTTSTNDIPRPWITEGLTVRMYRRRSNGTMAIHKAGATLYPHFYKKDGKGYANLSAPRDMTIFYSIDDAYDWANHSSKKPRASLVAKWASLKNQ